MVRRGWKAASLILMLPVLAAGHGTAVLTVAAPGDSVQILEEPATSLSNDVPELDSAVERARELRRLLDLYRDARFTGMLDEADVLAKQIVELSIVSYGVDSKNTARALTNLAIVQTESDDYDAAMRNFAAAIDIIERLDDRLSEDLISPLNALGMVQLKASRADLARESWFRSVHISQVNYGPHNYGQIETLNALRRMFLRAGLSNEALKLQKRIYYLRIRDVDPDDEDVVPTL